MRGVARFAAAAAVSSAMQLCALSARAQDVASGSPADALLPKPWGPRLSYTTVPGCLPESTFRDSVAVFYGGEDPFDPSAPDLLRVTLTKVPGGFRGSVEYLPAKGDPWPAQEMTHASCSALFHALVLVATLRIPDRPKARLPGPMPAPPPSTPTPPPKPPDPVASKPPPARSTSTPETKPPRPPPMDLTIALSASVLMTAGFTADVGPAAQVGAEARFEDWFGLHLELRGVFPGKVYAREVIDKSLGYSSERSFDASQISALLVPCIRFAKYFAGCAVGQAGFVIVQTPVDTTFLPSFGVGPRFAVEVPLGERFAVFGFGEALFYPGAPGGGVAFDVPGPDGEKPPNVAWDPSVVSGFFGAGLAVKFE